MELIKSFLKSNRIVNIAIVGDSMVDQYYATKVTRLNPEFPTKCIQSSTELPILEVCGGASNLCYQATHFKDKVCLLSLLDEYSQNIFSHIDTSHSVIMGKGHVGLKKRYYDGDFPLFRWDVEQHNYGEPEIAHYREKLKENFCKLQDIDCVILSDYDKGLFTEDFSQFIIRKCNENGIITIVDPKSHDFRKWKYCTVFKPNSKYVSELPRHEDRLHGEAEYLKERLTCKEVVITDSGEGLYISTEGRFIKYDELSKKRPKIRSVIGAGDNFALFLAMSLSRGFTLYESSVIAYNASTVYVEDKHNKPITPYQLARWNDEISAKIMSADELNKVKNGKLVMTNGCFDFGLTLAHVEILKMAKERGNQLVVAINSDESVRKLKGNSRPIMPLSERMKIVASLACVDFVVSFDEETPLNLISEVMPDLVIKGGDYRCEDVAGYGIVPIEILPMINSISTTEKIIRMAK